MSFVQEKTDMAEINEKKQIIIFFICFIKN